MNFHWYFFHNLSLTCIRLRLQYGFILIVYFTFACSSFCKIEEEFSFYWNGVDETYISKGENFPQITLFENSFYLFKSHQASLSIIDDSNSSYYGSDIFNNFVEGDHNYILLNPNASTPRHLRYRNDESNSTGDIHIIPYLSHGLLQTDESSQKSKLGSVVSVGQNNTVFCGAPNHNQNTGKIVIFSREDDGNFSLKSSLLSPITSYSSFGSTISSDPSSNLILAGSPNADNFHGNLYLFKNETNPSPVLISSGINEGELLGWRSSVSSASFAFSALSMTNPNGGYVSVWNNQDNQFIKIAQIQSLTPQFLNEFGFDLDMNEDFLLVGAPGEDDLIRRDTGAAYLFRVIGNTVQGVKILHQNRNSGDRFGQSLSLTKDFAAIAAPNGDGNVRESGVVYVYDFNATNLSITEINRIVPQDGVSGQKFGNVIRSVGEYLFILSPFSSGSGHLSVYKKGQSNSTWDEIHRVESNFINEFTSMDVQDGLIVLGFPDFSNDSGAIEIYENPSWDDKSIPDLPASLSSANPSLLEATEDTVHIAVDFNASHPFVSDEDLVWEVSSSNAPSDSFDINASNGEFIFYPTTNSWGNIEFSIQIGSGDIFVNHDFNISIIPTQDEPFYLDSNSYLPNAFVGELFQYTFLVDDPDLDDLSLKIANDSTDLPGGLSLHGFSLTGTPIVEGNYTFDLNLSDGNTEILKTFEISVLPPNDFPSISFENQEVVNGGKITFSLKENFSLLDWQNAISELRVSDASENNLQLSVVTPPLKGMLFTTTTFSEANSSIKYFPNLNAVGDDNFTLKIEDKDVYNPKEIFLTIEVLIEPNNSTPIIVSNPPPLLVEVGSLYHHQFEVFDSEGDFFQLSFEGLPQWLSFDGIRTIRGAPIFSDITDSDENEKFVVSVTDSHSEGQAFSRIVYYKVIPTDNFWPPKILEGHEIITSTTEDTEGVNIFLQADDNTSMELSWEIVSEPLNGIAQIVDQNSSRINLLYSPDGNFSGSDTIQIKLFNTEKPSLSDQSTIFINVNSVYDAPEFGSTPSLGLLLDQPFTMEIIGRDGDLSDRLILKKLKFPEWLKLDQQQSTDRVWIFKGTPGSAEDFDIQLELSDGISSAFQNYTLSVINALDELKFLNDLPDKVNLQEDNIWDFNDTLGVNAIDEIRVKWSVQRMPLNGSFLFNDFENGKINDIKYIPYKHFHGEDFVILSVTDGYSSLNHRIDFIIEEQADYPEFLVFPEKIIEDENEEFNIFLEIEDGDGISSSDLIFENLPDWLNSETVSSSYYSKKLRIYGTASVDDIGEYNIGVRVFGKFDGLSTYDTFKINVNYFNQPPVPWPQELFFSVLEDTSLTTWTDFIEAEDNESSIEDLKWSIHESPKNGQANISIDGGFLSYIPENNFSGYDPFTLKVTDGGGRNNSGFRHTLVPVSMQVKDIEDKPIFMTKPPTDSNLSGIYSWSDEEPFVYNIIVYDADWPWQGYPIIYLQSSLPSWAEWKNLGEGKATILGNPKWFDEGTYPFRIIAESGTDKVIQNFDLNIIIKDYPPRIIRDNGTKVNDKIKMYILEDNDLGEVEGTVSQLSAYNPDIELGDTLGWKILMRPTSGAKLPAELSWSIDENGYSKITNFSYAPPKHFFGVDKFIIAADEGDRSTQIEFEIQIKAVQDPPEFVLDDLDPSIHLVSPGAQFSLNVRAFDPDIQKLDFRLLYPSGASKWLSVSNSQNSSNLYNVLIEGLVPQSNGEGIFTLVASDPTGRFSLLPFEIRYR